MATAAKFGKSIYRDLQPSYKLQSEDLVSWTAHKTVTQSFQTPPKVQKRKEDLCNMLTALSTMHFTINTYVSKIITTKTGTKTKKVEWHGLTLIFWFFKNYNKSKQHCPKTLSHHITTLFWKPTLSTSSNCYRISTHIHNHTTNSYVQCFSLWIKCLAPRQRKEMRSGPEEMGLESSLKSRSRFRVADFKR